MKTATGITLIVALIIFLVLFAPVIFIWAVNTLFALSIPYTLKNLFAALLLILMFGRPGKS